MFDKNAISKENLYYANLKREKRIKDQLDEMEKEKKEMEKLNYQIEQDKLYQIEQKNRLKQNQYEEYSNYLRQKYSTPPQYREKLNIKLGGENRNIKKQNYNDEMDNLCINPTTQKNIYPSTPTINYSEMGRNYQKGYSHGYNIITGEVYSNKYNNPTNTNKNNKNENNNNNLNKDELQQKYNINISPEEYEEFLKFKEMKRQKELEEMQKEKYNNYMNNIPNIPNINDLKNNNNYPQYENAPNYNQIEQNKLYYDNRQYQNEMPPPDYQREKEIEKKNFEEQNNRIKQFYQQKLSQYDNNYLNKDIKDNFHYDKDNLNPQFQMMNVNNNREEQDNIYKQNLYKEDYERNFILNQQRKENENNYPSNQPNYYQRQYDQLSQNDYIKDENINKREQQFYPPLPNENENKNLEQYEYQRQIEKREQENIPYGYKEGENNIPSEYEKEMMMRQKYNDEIQFKNKISFPDNKQIMPINENESLAQAKEKEKENIKDDRDKYLQFLQSKNNEMKKNIKELERERYMQYLMNKNKENKEQNEPNLNYNNNYINKVPEEYSNENNYNQINNYQQYPEQIENNNYYQNPEKDYYNNNKNIPIQYNNYISENEYQKYQNQIQREREIEEQNYPKEDEPKYLSYKEQLERIKREEQFFENEKLKEQNKFISSNNPNNENNVNNKNVKEIISEFNENKRKNLSSEDHIFKTKQIQPTPPKYSDEPLTAKERKEIQRDYAKYLDWQINEKNARNAKTPFYKKSNPILDDDNNLDSNKYNERENPYQQMREKKNAMQDIPPNPYSNKNYDFNNKSNLGFNPITHQRDDNYNYNKNK